MSDVYAGIMGATVGVDDGLVVIDLSTPEKPEHTRLRLTRDATEDLALTLLDIVDGMP